LKTAKEETPSREAILNVELEEADLEPFLAQAARRAGQRVSIPGFRQGKAPRALVENFVGREAIREEAVELLVGPMVQKALDEEGVEVFDLPQVEVTSQEPVVLKVVAPLKPLVELGDYKDIRVETNDVVPTLEQTEEVIERLRYESCPWEPAERPVRFGDLLTMDVDGWMEGRRITQDRGIDYVLRQENRLPLPGFAVHLEGLNRDQVKEFTLTVPEDYPDKSAVGKECRFSVKVLEIKEKRLPEMDDEFARGLGNGYESMEALREKVKQDLKAAAEREEERRVQEEALSKLVEQANVELSPLLVEREAEHQMERRKRALQENRVDMDAYLSSVGKSEEELGEEIRTQAHDRLVRSLLLDKVAEEEKIEVSSQEIDEEIESVTSHSEGDATSVQNLFSSEEGRRSLRNVMLTRKVMGRLGEIATGLPETEPEATAAQPDEKESEGGDSDGN